MIVPSVLRNAAETVAPTMMAALDHLSPEIRQVVDYHMGWRDEAGNEVRRRGSKAVRPGLALLGGAAGGGPVDRAIPAAVAVEFIHNFAFLIDDVMDGDHYRRQRKTAWVVFGQGQAICAGTALYALAQQTIMRTGYPCREAALGLVNDTVSRMLAGQAEDLSFERRTDITVERCLHMTDSKTASLLSCATSAGAVLCGADEPVVRALAEFGRALGIAFQARDDLLGIWGVPDQTGGRPAGFDLRARKVTLPVAYAVSTSDSVSDKLSGLLSGEQLTEADIVVAAGLIEECGGRSETESLARKKVAEAVSALDGVDIDPSVRADFEAVAALGLPDDV